MRYSLFRGQGYWLKIAILGVVGLLATLTWTWPVTQAATSYTVNSLGDSGTGSGASGDLRYAISQANAGGGGTITFSVSGTITLTHALPSINSSISLDGSGQKIEISGNNTYRIFTVNPGKDFTLKYLTLRDGNNSNNDGGALNASGPVTVVGVTFYNNKATSLYGGAIFNNQSTLNIINSTFYQNTADKGGAIFNSASGTLNLINSTFYQNTAQLDGGAVNNAGTLTMYNTILYSNSAPANPNLTGSFTGNSNLVGVDPKFGAFRDNGGPAKTLAISFDGPAKNQGNEGICEAVEPGGAGGKDQRGLDRPAGGRCDIGALELSYFVVNTLADSEDANQGDTLCADSAGKCSLRAAIEEADLNGGNSITFSVSGKITLARSLPAITTILSIDGSGQQVTISGNNLGRPLRVQLPSSSPTQFVALNYLTITDGVGTEGFPGGGGLLIQGGSVRILGCTFYNNQAQQGGAVFSFTSVGLINSTLTGNKSVSSSGNGRGGAIYNLNQLIITNSTIVGNTADAGGGIYTVPTDMFSVDMVNSIVAQNSAASDPDISGVYGGYSNLSGVDPKLGILQDNGGLTPTMLPAAGSPAIDTGDPSGCYSPIANFGAGGRDQRGLYRQLGLACDIGAAEAYDYPDMFVNSVSMYEGNSGTTSMVFTVSLSKNTGVQLKVNYSTSDDTATVADNDYQATSGTLIFDIGQSSQTITVLVKGDTKPEPDESFKLTLSNPDYAFLPDRATSYTVTGQILNDDCDPLLVTKSTDTDTCGTLRYAINTANNQSMQSSVAISISPSINQIILDSNLPYLGASATGSNIVKLEAKTGLETVSLPGGQSVTRCVPGLKLVGSNLSSGPGLVLVGNTQVKGLAIGGFPGDGVVLGGSNNILSCSWVGTLDGVQALPNKNGVAFYSGSNNQLGLADQSASGNLISGNSQYGLALTQQDSTGNRSYYSWVGYQHDGVTSLRNGQAALKIVPPNNRLQFFSGNRLRA